MRECSIVMRFAGFMFALGALGAVYWETITLTTGVMMILAAFILYAVGEHMKDSEGGEED